MPVNSLNLVAQRRNKYRHDRHLGLSTTVLFAHVTFASQIRKSAETALISLAVRQPSVVLGRDRGAWRHGWAHVIGWHVRAHQKWRETPRPSWSSETRRRIAETMGPEGLNNSPQWGVNDWALSCDSLTSLMILCVDLMDTSLLDLIRSSKKRVQKYEILNPWILCWTIYYTLQSTCRG